MLIVKNMENVKAIGVKKLKNNLSAYLREVQHGVRILVTDRERVVAELREPALEYKTKEENPLYAQMVREGSIIPATHQGDPLPSTGIQLDDLPIQNVLDEMRSEEGRLP